jgi:hypothetical protein
MTASTRNTSSVIRVLAGTVLATCATVALADPLGYLQINGRISVQTAGSNAAVPISESAYTVFANDRIDTTHGSAVLVLNGGGVIGLSKDSSAVVRRSERTSGLEVELQKGAVAYSIPSHASSLTINVDAVQFEAVGSETIGTGDENARAGEAAGTLSVDGNRQVSALARAGDIRVVQPTGFAAAGHSNASTQANASGVVEQGGAAAAFITLASISEGNSAQVQTAGTVSVSATALPNTTAMGAAPASGTAESVDGNMAFVQSPEGSTLVVVGGEDDGELESVSP